MFAISMIFQRIGKDLRRSPVQTPTQSMTKYVVRHGWSRTYTLLSMGSFYHGLSVLMRKMLILTFSENLSLFNLCFLSLLPHLVPQGLSLYSPLPVFICSIVAVWCPKSVLAPGPQCSDSALHLLHLFHVSM